MAALLKARVRPLSAENLIHLCVPRPVQPRTARHGRVVQPVLRPTARRAQHADSRGPAAAVEAARHNHVQVRLADRILLVWGLRVERHVRPETVRRRTVRTSRLGESRYDCACRARVEAIERAVVASREQDAAYVLSLVCTAPPQAQRGEAGWSSEAPLAHKACRRGQLDKGRGVRASAGRTERRVARRLLDDGTVAEDPVLSRVGHRQRGACSHVFTVNS
eukprot:scaffold9627_cov123-Isochrysis_galbana.AAC.1